jgi:hypothetical protein
MLIDKKSSDVLFEFLLKETKDAGGHSNNKRLQRFCTWMEVVVDDIWLKIAPFFKRPGPAPTPGQVWELNQEIDLGNGHSLTVLRVTYDLTDGTQPYLRFDMESKTGITYATLFDKAHPLTDAGGGGVTYVPGPFSSDLYYRKMILLKLDGKKISSSRQ